MRIYPNGSGDFGAFTNRDAPSISPIARQVSAVQGKKKPAVSKNKQPFLIEPAQVTQQYLTQSKVVALRKLCEQRVIKKSGNKSWCW